jgi:hypothetical protein
MKFSNIPLVTFYEDDMSAFFLKLSASAPRITKTMGLSTGAAIKKKAMAHS